MVTVQLAQDTGVLQRGQELVSVGIMAGTQLPCLWALRRLLLADEPNLGKATTDAFVSLPRCVALQGFSWGTSPTIKSNYLRPELITRVKTPFSLSLLLPPD